MTQKIRQILISISCFAGLLMSSFSAQALITCTDGAGNFEYDQDFCRLGWEVYTGGATVPEPSILWLFGLGFVGLAIIRRINNKK